jgi:uncharacterized protein (DUF433 family)
MEKYDQWLRKGTEVTKRLRTDIQLASASWAHFEAINGENEESRASFRDAVGRLGHSVTIDRLMRIFVRDTLMALFRMSDDESKDRLTLLAVSRLLDDQSAIGWRLQAIPNIFEGFQEIEGNILSNKISLIKDRVPGRWRVCNHLKDPALYEFRKKLRPLRDAFLAHAGCSRDVKDPRIDEIRGWLKLSDELTSACRHVFMETPVDNTLEVLLQEYNLFWEHAAHGFVVNASRGARHAARFANTPANIERVTTNPKLCGGRPCLRGMRIRVSDVLDMLAAGASRAEILRDYPYLEDADITAALEYSARALQ